MIAKRKVHGMGKPEMYLPHNPRHPELDSGSQRHLPDELPFCSLVASLRDAFLYPYCFLPSSHPSGMDKLLTVCLKPYCDILCSRRL